MMKNAVLLSALAVGLLPSAASALVPLHGSIAITIPLPIAVSLKFGHPPVGVAVPAGLTVQQNGSTITIQSANSGKPLPRLVRFTAQQPDCWLSGVQQSHTLAVGLKPNQVQGDFRPCLVPPHK